MDVVDLLGSTLGIGFLAGLRLYATVFALGLAIRTGLYHPAPEMAHLQVLAQTPILVLAGIACVVEFFADKIPWLDSAWDSFHTFIRPVGAAILAAMALGRVDPALKLAIVLLSGGIAFTSHSSKAATRLLVNHSPEPFSNIALSLAGDLLVPAGLWLAVHHPLLVLGFVAAFVAIFSWISPKVFRLVRLEMLALWLWISQGRRTGPVPSNVGEWIGRLSAPGGIRCAASGNIAGLRNSIGNLHVEGDEIAFVARRLFHPRRHAVRIATVRAVDLKRGALLHRLTLRCDTGERTFYLFRDFDCTAERLTPGLSKRSPDQMVRV